jgi:hypothetical protein
MKNVLLFLLSLVLIASVVEAKIVSDSVYQIPRTNVAPVIDGLQDGVWKSIDWNMQRYYLVDGVATDSAADLTGMSKVMWDATNIYVLFYQIDDVLMETPRSTGACNTDAIELYFDGTNNHATETSLIPNVQRQFTLGHYLIGSEAQNIGTSFGQLGADTAGVEYKFHDMTDVEGFPGFMLEVKIPLANLGIDPSAGTMIGFELQQDESDDGTADRTGMSKWWSPSNGSWNNAANWGYAVLSDRVVDTVLEISKLPASTTITVDGILDPIYRQSNIVTMNLFRVGDPPVADPAGVNTDPMFGGFVTVYPLYDATNFYLFCDVVDPVVMTTPPSGGGCNTDAIELYFDGTNNHATETSLIPNVQRQFTLGHYLMGSEAQNIGTSFGQLGADTAGVEYKFTDHDARGNDGVLTEEGPGYNLEVKIPLANLGIDPALGTEIGFELQLDNADAIGPRTSMQKWWSSSNGSWNNAANWGYARLGPAIVTGVASHSGQVARSFGLAQNYPNPFNPSTEISFTLAKSEKVKLSVYNLLGKEVAVLVNGMRNAGSQTVTFDAKNLSSGVYFYKLEAGSTVLAKKMMLLK